MVAVPTQRYDLFIQSSRLLQQYRRTAMGLHPTGLEVAIAIQYARERLPWVGENQGLELAVVASDICDPFFFKTHPLLPHLPNAKPLVWPLFNHDRQGIPQPILPQVAATSYSEWRWLKACNGQAGIGCHAVSTHMWRDADFLDGDRDSCPLRFYDGLFPMTVDQGRQRCRFDDHPCGWQAGFPKMLQVIGSGHQAEVFRVDWTEAMWGMLVPFKAPIPVYPFLISLYFGSVSLAQGRQRLTPEQLCLDLDLDNWLFRKLFDLNPDSVFNRAVLDSAEHDELPAALTYWDDPFVPSGWGNSKPLPQPTGGNILLDPDEIPSFQGSGIPATSRTDPLLAERRRRRQIERTPEHNELLRRFRRWFRLAGLEVREDEQFFDFLAVKDNQVLLAEIKLLYHQDPSETIQEAVGQLFYYERFAVAPWLERGFAVSKALVVDRPLLGEYIDFLDDLGIVTFWLTEAGHIDGTEDALRILRRMGVEVRPDPELLEVD